MKVTGRFDKSDLSFLMNNQMLFLPHRKSKICTYESIIRDGDIWNCENTYNRPSHARAYAHTNRRFRIFAVTSVTLYWQNANNQ